MSAMIGRVAGGSARLAIGQYAAAGLGLAATAVAARLLGPTDFGVVALALGYPELVVAALAVKSSSVTTRYLAVFHAERRFDDLGALCKVAVGIDTAAYGLAAGIVVASSWVVATSFYGAPHLAPLMGLYAVSVPFLGGVPTALAVLTVTGRFGALAAVQVTESALRLALVVALILGGLGPAGAVLAAVLAQVVASAVRMALGWRALAAEGAGNWWRAPVGRIAWLRRDLGAMFGWNYLMITARGVMAHVPVMWLGQLRGPEEAGFLRLAITIATIVTFVESALGHVVSPILARATRATGPGGLTGLTTAWTTKLGLPLAASVVLAVFGLPWVIPEVFGAAFAGGVFVAQVVVGGTAVSGLLFWVGPYYFALGRPGPMAVTQAAAVTVALAVGRVAVESFGAMGLAAVVAAERAGVAAALAALVPWLAKRLEEKWAGEGVAPSTAPPAVTPETPVTEASTGSPRGGHSWSAIGALSSGSRR